MWFEGMEDMLKGNNKINFKVHIKPCGISLQCPHCNTDIYVNWNEVDEPEYWDDGDWGSIYRPCCGKEVSLGDCVF